MCGFWNETMPAEQIITSEEYVNQFMSAFNEFNLQRYHALSLYNAGSLLNEKEMPFSALEEIFCFISKKLPNLKQLIIESRLEYITKEKLEILQKILGNNIRLAVGIGFESQNDIVRNFLINKGVSKRRFEKVIDLTNSLNIQSIVYLILKPPFLTEREGIEDAIESTKYLSALKVSQINYETMTIEDNTLVNILYEKGYYHPPWLWSVIEILKRVHPFAKPFLTPLKYITEALDTPKNCLICTKLAKEKIYEKYCSDFSLSHFENFECTCKSEWLKITREQENTLSLGKRAMNILNTIA